MGQPSYRAVPFPLASQIELNGERTISGIAGGSNGVEVHGGGGFCATAHDTKETKNSAKVVKEKVRVISQEVKLVAR